MKLYINLIIMYDVGDCEVCVLYMHRDVSKVGCNVCCVAVIACWQCHCDCGEFNSINNAGHNNNSTRIKQ